MKTNSLTLALAMLALAMPAQRTMAQEAAYEIPIPTQRTIVRSISGDICLTYADNGTSATIMVTPQLINGGVLYHKTFYPGPGVTDIDILKSDHLYYFCGKRPGGGPIFGWGPLFNTAGVYIPDVSTTLLPPIGDYTVSALSKIATYKADDGGVHAIMTGSCYYKDDPNTIFSCIIDAYATSPTGIGWRFALYTLGKGDWEFHDVAVADKYIAVAGKTMENNRPPRVYIFDRPASSTIDMFTITPTVWFSSSTYTALDSMAIVHCGNELFAAACHATDNSAIDGLMITLYDCYSGPIPVITQLKVIAPATPGFNLVGKIKDIAFIKNQLFILQDIIDTSANILNAVFAVPISGGATCRYNIDGTELNLTSLDTVTNNSDGPLVAGVTTATPHNVVLHQFDFMNYSKNCSDNLIVNEDGIPDNHIDNTHMEPAFNIDILRVNNNITNIDFMNEICN